MAAVEGVYLKDGFARKPLVYTGGFEVGGTAYNHAMTRALHFPTSKLGKLFRALVESCEAETPPGGQLQLVNVKGW